MPSAVHLSESYVSCLAAGPALLMLNETADRMCVSAGADAANSLWHSGMHARFLSDSMQCSWNSCHDACLSAESAGVAAQSFKIAFKMCGRHRHRADIPFAACSVLKGCFTTPRRATVDRGLRV